MKKSELQEMIRLVVREEIENSLPQHLMEILAEKIAGGAPVVTESRQPVAPARPSAPALSPAQLAAKRKALVGLDAPLKQAPVAAPKTFSKNPVLNQVLNETVGGVPSEQEAEMMTPSVLDRVPTLTESVAHENPAIAAVTDALTRDYSKLIRAADEKARRSRP